ncbi:MAG: hypothetical protein QOG34_2320, partial [Frankiaceae bacterium]|nr:hypothetical protein [Frankiaceae bacterium]
VATYEPPSLTVTFNYDEPCPPVIGFASGSLTLGPDVLGRPNPAPEFFYWARVGLTAVLVIADTAYPPATAGAAGLAAQVPDGAAVAVFVPLLGAGNVLCPPGAPVDAYVAAAGAFA